MLNKPVILSSLTAVLLLGACAYAIDGAVQDVKFVTPGAQDARCDVYVEGLRYRVKPPQTINLYKSGEDLRIYCMAPGNRQREIIIKPQTEESAAWDTATAGVGLVWDYTSGAMFRYPDVIEINFEGAPVVPMPPPSHNNSDIRQPETYRLEEFMPSAPLMNDRRSQQQGTIYRRVPTGGDPGPSGAEFSEAPANWQDKGDLHNVMEGYGEKINPSPQNAPAAAPVTQSQPAQQAAPSEPSSSSSVPSISPPASSSGNTGGNESVGDKMMSVPARSKPLPLYPGQ